MPGCSRSPGRRVAGCDGARDRALDEERRLDLPRRDDVIDLRLGLAKDRDCISSRAQGSLRALLVGNRGLIIVLIDAFRGIQHPRAPQGARCLIERCRSRNEVRLRGNKIGAFYREKDLAFLDLIAEIAERLDEPALIGCEDLHAPVLVEIDVADGLFLDAKLAIDDGCDFDRAELRVGQNDIIGIGYCPAGGR